tara:strand:- start:301 stop:630 length:330 start_codon:yes stop_codon:yes gene_type:complete
MISLSYFILAAYGMTQLIVYASIFDKIRPSKEWLGGFGELFNCPMCMGFWVGVFLCGINGYTELFSYEHSVVNYFILGCLSSGTSYVLNMVFGDYGIKIQNLEAENDTH